eukprot:2309665-Rhodomonas_salina.7
MSCVPPFVTSKPLSFCPHMPPCPPPPMMARTSWAAERRTVKKEAEKEPNMTGDCQRRNSRSVSIEHTSVSEAACHGTIIGHIKAAHDGSEQRVTVTGEIPRASTCWRYILTARMA